MWRCRTAARRPAVEVQAPLPDNGPVAILPDSPEDYGVETENESWRFKQRS